VPAGLAVLDALIKAADVHIRMASDIDPGRWLIIFDGPLGDVEEALSKGVEVGGVDLLESLILPAAHEALRAALRGEVAGSAPFAASEATLGALECHTVLGTLAATDRALKAAEVSLLRLRLATHLGGSGHAVLAGEQSDVEAALAAAIDDAAPGVEVRTRAIARAAVETFAAAAQRSPGASMIRPFQG
jgi:microcompartment protein CcmL/EutN